MHVGIGNRGNAVDWYIKKNLGFAPCQRYFVKSFSAPKPSWSASTNKENITDGKPSIKARIKTVNG